MVAKQIITVTIEKGDHTFSFHIPVGTTWANAVDAASDILQHVGHMAKQSMIQQQPVQTPSAEIVPPTVVEGVSDGKE